MADPLSGALYYDSSAGKVMQYNGSQGYAGGGGGGGGGGGWGPNDAGPSFSSPTSAGGSGFPTYSSYTTGGGDGQVLGDSTYSSYSSAPAPKPDPYAQWGGKSAYDSLVSGFGTQKQGILDSANAWGDNAAIKYNRGILDTVQGYRNSQNALDRQSATNEAQRIQGGQGILGALGRGIKSGMTMLGNRNAGSSSASREIANAYGEVARRDQSNVNNQYATGNENIAVQQGLLSQDMNSKRDRFKEDMDMEINSKVEEARNALSTLDAQIAGASLPDRIAIEQEKMNIKNSLISKLQGYDQQLAQGIQGIAPTSREQNLSTARTNLSAGQVPADAFTFNDQVPAQFQGSGTSGLPLFTLNNKRRQLA